MRRKLAIDLELPKTICRIPWGRFPWNNWNSLSDKSSFFHSEFPSATSVGGRPELTHTQFGVSNWLFLPSVMELTWRFDCFYRQAIKLLCKCQSSADRTCGLLSLLTWLLSPCRWSHRIVGRLCKTKIWSEIATSTVLWWTARTLSMLGCVSIVLSRDLHIFPEKYLQNGRFI